MLRMRRKIKSKNVSGQSVNVGDISTQFHWQPEGELLHFMNMDAVGAAAS